MQFPLFAAMRSFFFCSRLLHHWLQARPPERLSINEIICYSAEPILCEPADNNGKLQIAWPVSLPIHYESYPRLSPLTFRVTTSLDNTALENTSTVPMHSAALLAPKSYET